MVEPPHRRFRWSLREVLLGVTVAGLAIGHVVLLLRLSKADRELEQLRAETGYLRPTDPGQIAAVRLVSDRPLTYRVRIRVPDQGRFRVAYSSVLPQGAAKPAWFAAVDVPPGESIVTVSVAKDPRDERWKIATLVHSSQGTKRYATTLPGDHVEIFRGSSDAVSAGVGRSMVAVTPPTPIRLFDERWLVGEGALMLYGDRPADRDQIGIYAELQSDIKPL